MVNFASRLEGKAEKDQILISRETKEKVKSPLSMKKKLKSNHGKS